MKNYNNPNLLKNKQAILLPLTFGLNFASDNEIKQHLKERYYFEECVYPDPDAMVMILQHIADDNRDYYNKLYETTQYKYNPLANVDADETWTEERDSVRVNNNQVNTNSGTSGENTVNEFPMDKNTERPVTHGTDTSTANSDSKANGNERFKDKITHRSRRVGNIGITMSQQLIEAERRIIIKIIERYCSEFNDCFMITI